jgi:hypothetical protein
MIDSEMSKSATNCSSLITDALNQTIWRQNSMSNNVQNLSPPQQQGTQLYCLPPNTNVTINSENITASISLDGRLYALLPIVDPNTGDTITESQIEQHSRYLAASNMTQLHQELLSRENNNANDRNVAPATTSNNTTAKVAPAKKSRTGKKLRPSLHIPPKAGGAIVEPNINDCLLGRGGKINKHYGNVQLRNIVAARQLEYLSNSTGKLDKAYIAADIVASIRTANNPPGRFLEQDVKTGIWYEIGDQRAIRKVLQALREHAPIIRSGRSDSIES